MLPPFTDLRSVQTLVDGDKLQIGYGAQDLSPHDDGAYTGDISGSMLAKLGCTYVVVGHSERREYHAETDEVVNAKVQAAYRHGLMPILCVGEGLTSGRRASTSRTLLGAARRRARRRHAEQVRDARGRLRAGLGDRHRRGGHPGGRPGGLRAPSGRGSPSCTPATSPTASGSCTAARSRRPTSRGSWRSPTSTAPWSAGRAWTPTEFAGVCRFSPV